MVSLNVLTNFKKNDCTHVMPEGVVFPSMARTGDHIEHAPEMVLLDE